MAARVGKLELSLEHQGERERWFGEDIIGKGWFSSRKRIWLFGRWGSLDNFDIKKILNNEKLSGKGVKLK